jgi:LDH2 family malate/lactate/ureidoglycolate dehydrogenase
MSAQQSGSVRIGATQLTAAVTDVFAALGVARDDAHIVADDLVTADLEGVSSHGVMLVPLYVERILKGSVSTRHEGEVVSDRDATVVIDAHNGLGQLTAHQAVKLAVPRAQKFGLAAVTVRNAFHFGMAGRYARMLADQGCVGIVMSNTRPLMPAPGGAEADMALSATAMGKIRLAEAAGKSIPEGWAIDSSGRPTTSPTDAIKGMLLPAAGPKGFGLAFAIDLLCGGLSDGAVGAEVRGLYGNATEPYRCSLMFLAIHAGHFVDGRHFAERVGAQSERVTASKRAPGVERIYAPGEMAYATRLANDGTCNLGRPTVDNLIKAAASAGITLSF